MKTTERKVKAKRLTETRLACVHLRPTKTGLREKKVALSRGHAKATAPVCRHRSLSLICSLAFEDIKKERKQRQKV